jgi:LPS-assembly protein
VTGRLLEGRYERALPTAGLGGAAWARFDTTALVRPSDADVLGRDVTRLGAEARWRNDHVTAGGLVAEVELGLGGDLYLVSDDSNFEDMVLRASPSARLDLRWPLQRSDGGVAHLVEPALMVAWSQTSGGEVPNEDSTLIDFDEGNLFALSRFPGYDRTEEGLRGSLAVGYTRRDPGGWSLGATLGRAFWAEDPGVDAVSAGLEGIVSDWLVSVRADHGTGFSLDSRTLVADLGSVSRSETRLAWQTERLALAAAHTYVRSDPTDRRLRAISEWTLDAGYRLSDTWSSSVDASYNATEATFVDAQAGLRYENECVRLDLSLSRNFATSATVTPVTDFTFAVSFGGYGDRRAAGRSC